MVSEEQLIQGGGQLLHPAVVLVEVVLAQVYQHSVGEEVA